MKNSIRDILESVDMKDSSGNNLISDEFIKKTETLFNGKIAEAKVDIEDELKEKYQGLLDKEVDRLEEEVEIDKEYIVDSYREEAEDLKESLAKSLAMYIDRFTDNWISENSVDINDAIEVDKAQRVLEAFEQLTSDFGARINDEHIDQTREIDSLKEKINSLVEDKNQYNIEKEKSTKRDIIVDVADDIEVSSIKERFIKIANKMPFDGSDTVSFEDEIVSFKESMLSNFSQKPSSRQYQQEGEDSRTFQTPYESYEEDYINERKFENKKVEFGLNEDYFSSDQSNNRFNDKSNNNFLSS